MAEQSTPTLPTDYPSVEPVNYTPEEVDYRGKKLIPRLDYAFQKRNKEYTEFNDMSYSKWYETNAKAANSYIEPRKNEEDVRIVTGTTEEKASTLLSSLLNYNLAPDIVAFDKDDLEVAELGEVMEDMVKKSRKIETPDYEAKRILIYKELLDQGTVFVEDTFVEMKVLKKQMKKMNWAEGVKISEIDWDKRQEVINRFCATNLISGLNVYLGSMKEFYIDNQPYLFTRRTLTRGEAEAMYGSWERWKHVPYRIARLADDLDTRMAYNDWSLEEITSEIVEEIKYQDPWTNEYMIVLNGVMMLPVGFPLSALTGKSQYTIAKGDLFPIGVNFAYSKAIPAKLKVDQQIYDEMLKMVILKTRQSFKPPMANNTGKTLSSRILYPGKFTPDIDGNKLKPIIEANGVTQSEFAAIQFIKEIIDGKSIAPIMEGQQPQGDPTARQVVEQKQQSLLKLGVAILGVINLEKRMCKLRLLNIIEHWTKPIDRRVDGVKQELVDVYRTLTVDSEFENSQRGKRIIRMIPNEPPEDEQVMAEEDILEMSRGVPHRIVHLNPEQLRNMELMWHMEITPEEKDTSELRKALFGDNLREAIEFFGPSVNLEYFKEMWSSVNSMNMQKAFIPMPQGGMAPGMPGAMPMPGNAGETQGLPTPQSPPSPSINTLAAA